MRQWRPRRQERGGAGSSRKGRAAGEQQPPAPSHPACRRKPRADLLGQGRGFSQRSFPRESGIKRNCSGGPAPGAGGRPGGGRAETQNLRSCFQFAAQPSGVGRSADGAYLRASPGRLCGPLACPPSPWLSVCLSRSLTSLCLVESRKSLRSLVPLKGGNQLPLTPRCWLLRSGRPPGPSLAEKKRWLCPPGTEWLRKSRPQSSASGQESACTRSSAKGSGDTLHFSARLRPSMPQTFLSWACAPPASTIQPAPPPTAHPKRLTAWECP